MKAFLTPLQGLAEFEQICEKGKKNKTAHCSHFSFLSIFSSVKITYSLLYIIKRAFASNIENNDK